jgi:hypothetical protein
MMTHPIETTAPLAVPNALLSAISNKRLLVCIIASVIVLVLAMIFVL